MEKRVLLSAAVLVISIALFSACSDSSTLNNSAHKPIKVGAIIPLTGPAAFIGESISNGIKLAEEENGGSLAISYEDSQADPKNAVSTYQRLQASGVKVYIPTFTAVVNAVAPLSAQEDELLLATSVSASNITTQNKNLYRLFVHADGDADLIADYSIDSLSLKNVGVIYINDDFGKDYLRVFKDQLTKRGGSVCLEIPYARAELDFKNIITKAKNETQCEAFYLIGYDQNLIQLLKSYHTYKIKKPILSIATIGQKNVAEELGNVIGELPPIYYTTTAFAANKISSEVKEKFVANYTKRFGKAPDYFAAFSYDLVNILAQAHKNDPQHLKEYINKTTFQGVMGEIAFSRNRDSTFKMYLERLN